MRTLLLLFFWVSEKHIFPSGESVAYGIDTCLDEDVQLFLKSIKTPDGIALVTTENSSGVTWGLCRDEKSL